MQRITEIARELLESGTVNAVLGWQKGDLPYDTAPMIFKAAAALEVLVHNGFCGSNLSKYLVEQNKAAPPLPEGSGSGIHSRCSGGVWGGAPFSNGKTLVFLKPCDTYSLNQLLSEHRVDREKLYIVGIGCSGMIDVEKLRAKGFKGILEVNEDGDNLTVQTMYGSETCLRADVLLEKCLGCKGKEHMVYDEIINRELSKDTTAGDKFAKITELEEMNSIERFAFWRGELSKCIRCNACRNTCPACTCLKCVFDNPQSGVNAKVNATEFEENMFHIIRAFHVAGRCSDCGECTRVCPQGIPLHLLNRKFIKDINSFYGEFQAGETTELCSPLLRFDYDDTEPNTVSKREAEV